MGLTLLPFSFNTAVLVNVAMRQVMAINDTVILVDVPDNSLHALNSVFDLDFSVCFSVCES